MVAQVGWRLVNVRVFGPLRTACAVRCLAGRTYRHLQVPVLYRFGHGLSYTTFEYSGLQIKHSMPFGGPLQYAVSLRLRNTGKHSVWSAVHPAQL